MPRSKLNELLFEATGDHGQVFFCNSGAEANEAALKLARKFGGRGRHVVVSALGSFHGRTLAALAATGQPAKHEPFQPMPDGFRHVALGRSRRARPCHRPVGECDASSRPCRAKAASTRRPTEYLQGIRALCDERGMLMILDESADRLCSHRDSGLASSMPAFVPDVVTMAKAMGNGFPVGACWARTESRRGLSAGRPWLDL